METSFFHRGYHIEIETQRRDGKTFIEVLDDFRVVIDGNVQPLTADSIAEAQAYAYRQVHRFITQQQRPIHVTHLARLAAAG